MLLLTSFYSTNQSEYCQYKIEWESERASKSKWVTAWGCICGAAAAVLRNYKYCLHFNCILYTRRKRPNKSVYVYTVHTYLIRCMLSLSPTGAACDVCLLRVKMLIAATFVLLSYTFNMLFRCKRHRSLFVCLQSAVSLSSSHTHSFFVCWLFHIPHHTTDFSINYCCVVVDFVVVIFFHFIWCCSCRWISMSMRVRVYFTSTRNWNGLNAQLPKQCVMCIFCIHRHTQSTCICYCWYMPTSRASRVCVW